jgi:23S rRNA (uracil1939-C5)-methyltransferase
VATQARDLRTLVEVGYGLEELVALDMFPGTAHVETVARLRAA